jgi:hypothetical protein
MQQNYIPSVAMNLAELAPVFAWSYTGDGGGGATTAVGETVLGTVGPGNEQIALAGLRISPAAALTASDTNYATFTVNKRTSAAPGTAVPIATFTTKVTGGTGSWTAWQAVAVAVAAGTFVAPGDVITVSTAKASSGVVLPQLTLAGFVAIN